jgi:hypothetical protein
METVDDCHGKFGVKGYFLHASCLVIVTRDSTCLSDEGNFYQAIEKHMNPIVQVPCMMQLKSGNVQVRVGPIVYIYSFVAIIVFMLLQVHNIL